MLNFRGGDHFPPALEWIPHPRQMLLIKYTFFLYATLFLNTASCRCCLTFSGIELQVLLRSFLIHVAIILLRHILYLVYLCLCLGLGQFMSYPCDLLFIFILIFIAINHIMLLKQTHLLFVHFIKYILLFLDDNLDEESE